MKTSKKSKSKSQSKNKHHLKIESPLIINKDEMSEIEKYIR